MMITASELLEAGFISEEATTPGLKYITFTKFLDQDGDDTYFEMVVTHELKGDKVVLCYVELGIDNNYRKLAGIDSIDKINQLLKLLESA